MTGGIRLAQQGWGLIVDLRLGREENRVRLTSRGGYDWTGRYPWIVESALENRHPQLVIDGPSLLLLLARRVARFQLFK